MTIEQANLWERIQGYKMDDPHAAFPFSGRLARDNGWSEEYADRVVWEYRRFAFLAVVAGHPVSPSDAVDQAWHLHILYTRTYWEGFCRAVLGKTLHHEPTKGGSVECAKFHDWYQCTLESYRRVFDEEPPQDIWPPARQRFGEDIHFVRVNIRRNWIVPKPGWINAAVVRRWSSKLLHSVAGRVVAVAAAVGIGCMSCAQAAEAWTSTLKIDGPTFLAWFVSLGVAVHSVAAWLRWKLRVPSEDRDAPTPRLDPYAVAYLSDGARMALNGALLNLTRARAIEIKLDEKRVFRKGPVSNDAHPVEKGVYEAIADPAGSTIAQLREWAASGLDEIRTALRSDGLLVAEARSRWVMFWPTLLALVVPVVGCLRLVEGIERNKSVGHLAFLTLLALVGALAGYARAPFRSRWGEDVLGRLRRKHADLPAKAVGESDAIGHTVLPLMIGLFGMEVLAGTSLDGVRQVLERNSREGGCGAGCGGDGGGGCGGCGGCG